ncbi:glutathione S-transferase [Pararhodobacter marinus]|uniref:glutathione S-transferase n=1 Tax=Pararhodobacter marinus TaxID=2184063 RepID=UPI0035153B6E
MTYDLCIADRAYSSWSLRGWLLFAAFDIPVTLTVARLYEPGFAETLKAFHPARTVPALRLPEGVVVAESLAIAEELATRHPGAGLWPTDPKARAIARALVSEMHAGFTALRTHCPMNLRVAYADCAPPQAVLDDLARLQQIWDWARAETGASGPWLCGTYCAADAFFAPVAARIAGYTLPVGPQARAYVEAHLSHGPFRRWRAMGLVDGPDQPFYDRPWARRAWPGPEPLGAEACEGPSINEACPYSGRPVTHVARFQLPGMGPGDTRVVGFCNTFCRDKSVADPEAWPQLMALLQA